MKQPINLETPFKIQLSFSHIAEELEKVAEGQTGQRADEARELLGRIAQHPELTEGITDVQQVEDNADLIREMLKDYFPAVLTKNEIKAISLPFRKLVFNHTERFKSIIADAGENFDISIRDLDEHQSYVMSCCIIMNEIYGTRLDFGKPFFFDIPMANGVIKHYRLLYNADYLDVFPTEKSVMLSQDDIDLLTDNYDNLELWKEKFPAESWILKGFSIMTLYDATVENAVSIFKEQLLVLNHDNFHANVESIFRSIYRTPDIRIGFTVFDQEEGKFASARFGHKVDSFILPDELENDEDEVLCTNSFRSLISEKVFFAISDTEEFRRSDPDSVLAEHLLEQGIHSFILAPVVKNGRLLGVLELVSSKVKELNSINANKLLVVMPFLTDSLDRLVADLQNQVHAFIQEKYTTVHSSVYWKFREEAIRAITQQGSGFIADLDEIVFPDVYPLYGQIDIKESSDVRNSSVQNDLRSQLIGIIDVLKELQQQPGSCTFVREELQLMAFINDLALPLKANTEQLINAYIENKIHTRFESMTGDNVIPVIQRYFKENEKASGRFHIYRRKYEETIATINEKMASIIDQRQVDAQVIFPHYYERFKTDGVEHNLYIGRSIAPRKKFNEQKVHDLRLWQIRVLCEMENAHHRQRPTLPYPLEVTTLILIYNSKISIRFRMDEKRFDVDGSYNARFEIVKKRIDKALIKDSKERITQAGRITIVYSSDAEEDEYIKYISILQDEGILEDRMEIFDIEDLQGVSGLKGLRARIVHQGVEVKPGVFATPG